MLAGVNTTAASGPQQQWHGVTKATWPWPGTVKSNVASLDSVVHGVKAVPRAFGNDELSELTSTSKRFTDAARPGGNKLASRVVCRIQKSSKNGTQLVGESQKEDVGATTSEAPSALSTSWWDAMPDRQKIIYSTTLSFVICNMVMRPAHPAAVLPRLPMALSNCRQASEHNC